MDKAGMEEIELEKELEPIYQNPVLIVEAGKPGPIWTLSFDAESSLQVGKESWYRMSNENEKNGYASVYLHNPDDSLH